MRRTVFTGALVWTLSLFAVFIVYGRGIETSSVPVSAVTTTTAAVTTSSATSAGSTTTASTTAAVTTAAAKDARTTIRVLRGDKVETMPLDAYLSRVVAGEMPADFPQEALRAQAIAARTMAYYRINQGADGQERHENADVCDDPSHCSACVDWADDALAVYAEAVQATDGLCALWESQPIVAAFHAVSGGRTESSADIWGGELAYLVSVDSPGEEDAPRYRESFTFTLDEFRRRIHAVTPEANLTGHPSGWFKNSTRTDSGTILQVYVGGETFKGAELRGLFGLTSADFTVAADDNTVTFTCTGYGHGVGLSQYGARAMALSGHDAEAIIRWYYQGTTVGTYPPADRERVSDRAS